MLIWLASYPRSGNRFFRAVATTRFHMPQRTKHLDPPETDPHYELVRSLDVLAASPRPALVKTHEFPDADTHPAIYLLRDGRDAMVSYAHFALVIDEKRDPAEVTPAMFHDKLRNMLLAKDATYGSWAENVTAWAKRPGTVLVRYEDLVRDPGVTVDAALAAAGCPTPRVCDEVPTFEQMKKVNTKIVRRGVVGSWKDEFPSDLIPLFWERNGEVMRAMGYNDAAQSAA